MINAAFAQFRIYAVLFLASLVPVYITASMMMGSDIFLSVFFTVFVIVMLSHLYYGYKWAKYAVAFLSLTFAIVQFFLIKIVSADLKVLLFLLLCVLLIINTFFLLRANSVSVFLSQKANERSVKELLLLKVSRWVLYALLVFGIAKDLLRLAT